MRMFPCIRWLKFILAILFLKLMISVFILINLPYVGFGWITKLQCNESVVFFGGFDAMTSLQVVVRCYRTYLKLTALDSIHGLICAVVFHMSIYAQHAIFSEFATAHAVLQFQFSCSEAWTIWFSSVYCSCHNVHQICVGWKRNKNVKGTHWFQKEKLKLFLYWLAICETFLRTFFLHWWILSNQ